MNNTVSIAQSNYVHSMAQQAAAKSSIPMGDVRPKTLIIHLPLKPTDPNYVFNLNEKEFDKNVLESIGIKEKNAFFAGSFGLLIAKVPVYKDAQNQDKPQFGNAVYYSFPDATAFANVAPAPTTEDGWASEAEALRSIYNGTMTINSDTTETLGDYSTSNFYFVPQKQSDATSLNEQQALVSRNLGKIYTFFADKTSKVSIKLGAGSYKAIVGALPTAVETVGYRNYLCLVANGSEILNAAASERKNFNV